MKQFPLLPILLILLILALVTPAVGAVEVLDSSGLVEREVWGAPSPTPGYCYWEKDENAGPEFHATEADGDGNDGCPYPWLAHCDGDSLVYHGTWPLIEGEYLLGADYRATLTCTVNLTEPTRLDANRTVSGNLDVDGHALSIIFPDGTLVNLLPAGTGPDQAALELQPGLYHVTLEVEVAQGGPVGTPVDPYDGRVRLVWEDPGVPVSTTSWSLVKAMFR